MVNDISVALDKRQHYASLFIYLSGAFDTVEVLTLNSGLSEQAVAWFTRYLKDLSASDMTVYPLILQPSAKVCHKALY